MARSLDRYTIVIDGDNKKLELAAKNTIRDLGGLSKAANDANGKVGNLASGIRYASTNAAAFQGPLGGVSGRLGALATLLTNINPMWVSFGLGVSGASIFLVSAVKELDEFNLRNNKTEALLKATGYASGFTADQLDRMAKSVALNTLASVEGIKDTQNVLLTFKGVSKESFETAIELSQDMAAVMGTDSKAAALQLGKALESPTQGISALKRAGVSFSQSQKDMIRDMEDAGRVVDAQRFILETLQNQIGGAGAAEADGTVVGAIDTFSQRWQQLKINVADSSGAANAATAFFNTIADGIAGINQDLWPDDDRRMQELAAKRMELKAELDSLSKGENTGFLSMIIGTESEWYNVQRELKAVSEEMRQIQDRKKDQIIAEQEAQQSADKFRLEREKELQAEKAAQDAKDLAKVHAKHEATLAAMDMQFAGEEEKANLNYERNLARIDAWQVSEQELVARGFESMAELKQSYRDMAFEQLETDLQRIEQRQADHEAKKTEKQLQQEKVRAANEKASQRDVLSSYAETSGQFLDLMEDSGKQQSALFKVLFATQKAAQVVMTVANAEAGAAAVTAREAPTMGLGAIAAGNVVRAAGYASAGIIAGQAIAGIAHGGIDDIPEESTWLLQKGERVLSPKQNIEISEAAQRINAGGGGAGVTVNVHADPSLAVETRASKGLSGEDVIDIMVADAVQGGRYQQSREQMFGDQRVGRR